MFLCILILPELTNYEKAICTVYIKTIWLECG